jgi:hypothetical protein
MDRGIHDHHLAKQKKLSGSGQLDRCTLVRFQRLRLQIPTIQTQAGVLRVIMYMAMDIIIATRIMDRMLGDIIN